MLKNSSNSKLREIIKKILKPFLITFTLLFIIMVVLFYQNLSGWCGPIGGSCNPKYPPMNWHLERMYLIIGMSILLSAFITAIVTLIKYFLKK